MGVPVRVRFAPSPTGLLHVGALRTVVFDHLLRQKEGGSLILRIEDTDRSRYNPESEAEFVETLRWTGIEFDEGPHVGGPNAPYRQSERRDEGLYAPFVEKLLADGHAYRAYETPEELDAMREFQQVNRMATGYFGGEWRDATPEKLAGVEGRPFVIRQRVPRDRKIVVRDLVRGELDWDSNTVDDQVLVKADGMPTYHLASMVDDHLMGITHVLRGDEWLPSAPKHALLFEQLGLPAPFFVHCPVIVGPDGKKLSKRHGATRVLDYAAQGILPEALTNFIALIGWSAGEDREALLPDELIQAFDLYRIQSSPGRFDLEKLRWLNGWHLRQLSVETLLAKLREFIVHPHTRTYWTEYTEENPQPNKPPVVGTEVLARLDRILACEDEAYLLAGIREERERVVTLADFGEALEFFLVDLPTVEEKARAKWLTQPHVPALLAHVSSIARDGAFEEVRGFYESSLKEYAAANGFEKLGPIVHPIRVALTGKTTGPGLYELMTILGPERIRRRIEAVTG